MHRAEIAWAAYTSPEESRDWPRFPPGQQTWLGASGRLKTKMLSDALGHHACLVQPMC